MESPRKLLRIDIGMGLGIVMLALGAFFAFATPRVGDAPAQWPLHELGVFLLMLGGTCFVLGLYGATRPGGSNGLTGPR